MFTKEFLEKGAAIVTIIGFPVILISMAFSFVQIKDLRSAVSSQNNISLNTEFFGTTNSGIISAIDEGQPLLVSNKGKFTENQLDRYLGDFVTIYDSYKQGFLTEHQLCSSFSYYITKAWQNQEIEKYIGTSTSPSDAFTELPKLNTIVLSSNDKTCKD